MVHLATSILHTLTQIAQTQVTIDDILLALTALVAIRAAARRLKNLRGKVLSGTEKMKAAIYNPKAFRRTKQDW
jgi:hypothetical protein